MKNTQKITRVKLDIPGKDSTYHLFGLVSSEPDYKISLALNRKLCISLKNKSPLHISDDSGKELIFSRFTYTNLTDEIIYNLYSNRADKFFLLKKLKNIDYIFQIHYPYNNSDSTLTASLLRETESVNAVFNIDIGTFTDKNLQYLIQ